MSDNIYRLCFRQHSRINAFSRDNGYHLCRCKDFEKKHDVRDIVFGFHFTCRWLCQLFLEFPIKNLRGICYRK